MIPRIPPSEGDHDDYADLATPDGRLLWTGPEMFNPDTGMPIYTTGEVGKLFFGRGVRWMYKYLLTDPKLSHPEVGTLKLMRNSATARKWRLCDIELFAHILAAHGVVRGFQLARTVRMIKLNAQMWGYGL